jgi:hypothetical protein
MHLVSKRDPSKAIIASWPLQPISLGNSYESFEFDVEISLKNKRVSNTVLDWFASLEKIECIPCVPQGTPTTTLDAYVKRVSVGIPHPSSPAIGYARLFVPRQDITWIIKPPRDLLKDNENFTEVADMTVDDH